MLLISQGIGDRLLTQSADLRSAVRVSNIEQRLLSSEAFDFLFSGSAIKLILI